MTHSVCIPAIATQFPPTAPQYCSHSNRLILAWRGVVVLHGVLWRGVVLHGVLWRGVVLRGVLRRGVLWRGRGTGTAGVGVGVGPAEPPRSGGARPQQSAAARLLVDWPRLVVHRSASGKPSLSQ